MAAIEVLPSPPLGIPAAPRFPPLICPQQWAAINPGFETEPLLVLSFDVDPQGYDKTRGWSITAAWSRGSRRFQA
jgi:hypothetical protein